LTISLARNSDGTTMFTSIATTTYSARYDADTRLSSLSVTNVSTSSVLFRSQRGYDAASNVTGSTSPLFIAYGAQLGYDNEGRLSRWQNAPASPTTTDGFLYEGAGNQVEQLVTVNGSITTTEYSELRLVRRPAVVCLASAVLRTVGVGLRQFDE
jgi:hypothetical protein